MGAGILNLIAEQGVTNNFTFQWNTSGDVGIELTGIYKLYMQVRPGYKDKTDTIYLDLSSDGGEIILDDAAVNGAFSVHLDPADTVDLAFDSAIYDIEAMLIADSSRVRLLQGTFELYPEVTE